MTDKDKSEHIAHLLKEGQRRYDQASELIDEIVKELDVHDEQAQVVADAVFQSWTTSQLLSKLEIKVSLPHAEDELKYTAGEGWKKK